MSPPDLDEIRHVIEKSECLCTKEQIEGALDQLAQSITEALHDANPIVYVVMNGGLILAGRLLPRLPFPLELAYLHATRYGHAHVGTLLDWRVRPTQDLRGRTVLILDDILDEGHTLNAIMKYLREEGAERVYSAVLVHKVHDRKALPGMRSDFTGMDVPDKFLFGLGMDYKGYWRNAPAIYAVKE